jgi:hypothetical protein
LHQSILNWRQLRKSRYRKNPLHSSSFYKQGIDFPHTGDPPPYKEENLVTKMEVALRWVCINKH